LRANWEKLSKEAQARSLFQPVEMNEFNEHEVETELRFAIQDNSIGIADTEAPQEPAEQTLESSPMLELKEEE
jgi:hypothetical protein